MTYYLRIIVHKQNVNCIKNNLTNFTQHRTCNHAMLCNGTVRKIRVRFFLGSSQHLLRLPCLIIEIKNLNCSFKTSASFITVSVKNDEFLRITLFPEFHTDNVRMSAFLLFNMEGLLIRLNDVARPP